MLNRSKGNMYPWVTHTWNAIRGRCYHNCMYCYMKKFWNKLKEPYLDEKCLKDNLGSGNVIFVGSSIDMWAENVPDEWILKVLQHCLKYPSNTYLFQSKNPKRFLHFISNYDDFIPNNVIWGTTIETNRLTINYSKAPAPITRYFFMKRIEAKKMVSIEPIMDFDLDAMVKLIYGIKPKFVSIGADSKGNNLPEPPAWKIKKLIEKLKEFTEVKIKKNLNRILKDENE
ncbi:MAG: DUF5131 family protein [Thermoplasmata archaeon]|nr:DUF5131 family protein [Thermoplasmata archaeon]